MLMSGAQIVEETLIEQGCDTLFGYPGGQVLHIYDALYENAGRLRHILSAHEQGAAHAADGYARATGKVGVVLATSGPGATNLVTGIATAYLDSTPRVAITGNVPCSLIGRDSFQEVDIMGVTMPITKHNYMVKDTARLADTIREAFQIARSGRPGPVLIDVPKDVQIGKAEYEPKEPLPPCSPPRVDEARIREAVRLLREAKRPYIYSGGGVILSGAWQEVMELSQTLDAPVGCSMMGLSAIPHDFPNKLGMQGMHGHYAATMAKARADLIVAVGVRFSDRATGDTAKYAHDAKILHIDIDPAEIGKNVAVYMGIHGNVRDTLQRILAQLEPQKRPDWQSAVAELRKAERSQSPAEDNKSLHPREVIAAAHAAFGDEAVIATDVGQHQLWTAQHYPFTRPRSFLTSGGLGTMGFGMGAAIGGIVGTGRRGVLFTGDGSFGMNCNELATAVSQNLPLTVVIMNNGVLGMVRQWQTIFFSEHYSSTTLRRKTDFVKLAEAYGAAGMKAETREELDAALRAAAAGEGVCVIDCRIHPDEWVLPMVPPGGSAEQIITRKGG